MSIGEFLDMMTDTVSLEPFVAQDAFGAPTYGAAVDYPAYVEGKVRMVRDAQGQERASTVTVYLGATPPVSPADRLTLPAGFTPQQPPIIAVAPVRDDRGLHHVEVFA